VSNRREGLAGRQVPAPHGLKQVAAKRAAAQSEISTIALKGAPPHTIVIWLLSSLAKMLFGIRAWTPRTMSTTWVTRKLTAMLHSA